MARGKSMAMRVLKWLAAFIVLAVIALAVMFTMAVGPGNAGRLVFGIGAGYDKAPPRLPATLSSNAILIFSKTNGFRDDETIVASNRAFGPTSMKARLASLPTKCSAACPATHPPSDMPTR